MAPFNGVVDEVKVKVGEMVAMGFTGIRVVNTSKLKIKSRLADTYINQVKRGDKVSVQIPDLNKEIEATITYAGSVVDPISRTFNVEVALHNTGLKPNMVTMIKINDETIDNVIVVNENILQTNEEGKFLMTVKRNGSKLIATKTPVTTGSSYNGQIIITNGLNVGDELIISGFQDLIEGQEVKL